MNSNARIPSRPLDYTLKDLAFPKEFLINYDNAMLYVKQANGELKSVTEGIEGAVLNNITTNTTFIQNINITIENAYQNGEAIEKTLQDLANDIYEFEGIADTVNNHANSINDITNSIGDINNNYNGISNSIGDINNNYNGISNTLNNAYNTANNAYNLANEVNAGIYGTDGISSTKADKLGYNEYTLTTGIWSSMGNGVYRGALSGTNYSSSSIPILDLRINSSDANNISKVELLETEFSKIYKVESGNNSLLFYAKAIPSTSLPIKVIMIGQNSYI